MTFKLLGGARDDLRAARHYYDTQRPGLGQEFGSEVRRLIGQIVESPMAGAPWPDVAPELGVRRRLLQRFPFALAYYLDGDMVIVAAVVHTRQAPHWLGHLR